MQIVINADDFGFSADSVDATIESFEAGALTSATIMPRMPGSAAAIGFARAHGEFSFGVHLTFTGDGSERPLVAAGEVPDLVDSSGRFLDTGVVRRRALLGRLETSQIEAEMERQIAWVRDHGIPLTHVDSHRHLHKLRPFRRALGRVLPRFGISRVRAVQDVYLHRPISSATYWLGPLWQRALASSFVTTDHFYMPTSARDDGWERPLLERIDRLAGSTIEIGVHPGTQDAWRAAEARSVTTLAEMAAERGHALATWSQVGSG
jgi:predicted glycoside hydrolase/deacetylase ChbG (UPF0249 family)